MPGRIEQMTPEMQALYGIGPLANVDTSGAGRANPFSGGGGGGRDALAAIMAGPPPSSVYDYGAVGMPPQQGFGAPDPGTPVYSGPTGQGFPPPQDPGTPSISPRGPSTFGPTTSQQGPGTPVYSGPTGQGFPPPQSQMPPYYQALYGRGRGSVDPLADFSRQQAIENYRMYPNLYPNPDQGGDGGGGGGSFGGDTGNVGDTGNTGPGNTGPGNTSPGNTNTNTNTQQGNPFDTAFSNFTDVATGGTAPPNSSFMGGNNPLTAESLLGSQGVPQGPANPTQDVSRGGYLEDPNSPYAPGNVITDPSQVSPAAPNNPANQPFDFYGAYNQANIQDLYGEQPQASIGGPFGGDPFGGGPFGGDPFGGDPFGGDPSLGAGPEGLGDGPPVDDGPPADDDDDDDE